MNNITAANIKNVVLSIPRLTKDVKAAGEVDKVEIPKPVQKDYTVAGATRFVLTEAIMEYHSQKNTMISLEENAGKVSRRVALSRRKKKRQNRKKKA